MLTMKMGDGATITVTGEEARGAADSLKKVIYEHSKIAAIHKLARATKKDTTAIRKDTRFLVDLVPRREREEKLRISIEGARLKQYEAVKAYMGQHPGCSIYQASQVVWRKISGGYPSAKSLHRFCLEHYSLLA